MVHGGGRGGRRAPPRPRSRHRTHSLLSLHPDIKERASPDRSFDDAGSAHRGQRDRAQSIRGAVAAVDEGVAVYQMQTAEQMLADAGSLRRFDMWLIGVFAALALMLAGVGVYGVMAYSVSQRTREIGITIALGAQRRDVLRMVLMEGARMSLAGVGLGVIGAIALTRVMQSLLYEVSPTDVPTFALVALMVLALILAACLVPSMRPTRVDPVATLRYE
jgi:putative ABC transport system permease protein